MKSMVILAFLHGSCGSSQHEVIYVKRSGSGAGLTRSNPTCYKSRSLFHQEPEYVNASQAPSWFVGPNRAEFVRHKPLAHKSGVL